MGTPQEVLKLVERFDSNRESYMSGDYKEANVPGTKTMLQRQIEATDKELDRQVYTLYGLTEEEIKIVEGD